MRREYSVFRGKIDRSEHDEFGTLPVAEVTVQGGLRIRVNIAIQSDNPISMIHRVDGKTRSLLRVGSGPSDQPGGCS
jgi:hypothetical protein